MSDNMFGLVFFGIIGVGVLALGVIALKLVDSIHEGQKNYYLWLKEGKHHQISDYYTKEDLEKWKRTNT